MEFGRHASIGIGNPQQGPGKHRSGHVTKGVYRITLGTRDRCDAEYYLFEVVGERDNNDPNTRR